MAVAVIWDAYRRNQYEGVVAKRHVAGITIDLSNGVRMYATTDRIISDTGAEENVASPPVEEQIE